MVNAWIEKSRALANSTDYLDALAAVYPVELGGRRPLAQATREDITRLHQAGDGPGLVTTLLDLERFPIDFPFAALLKSNPGLARLNPRTVEKIAQPLLSMHIEELLTLCTLPKPANTQMGPMFRKFVRDRLDLPFLKEAEFEAHRGVAFLDGGDRELQNYANRPDGLDCSLRKGLDFLFKTASGDHYIGEAKFFSSTGGNQNHAFDEALDFLGHHRGLATRMVVLDGVVWFDNMQQRMQREIVRQNAIALSSLLLRDFVATAA